MMTTPMVTAGGYVYLHVVTITCGDGFNGMITPCNDNYIVVVTAL